MINFCTLYDSNYMSRGLALYQSLVENCPDFHLYVVSFDDRSYNYLTTLNLPHQTVIPLNKFEDAALLAVKPTRTTAEYCWTCTPSIILYCIRTFNLPSCTYVDSDIFFYANPIVLFEEMQGKSILITDHYFTPEYDTSKENGRYCVQFVFFKNNEHGLSALTWWRDRCIEWCHAYLEDNKFGDQKYLDDWPTRFPETHVLRHRGGGIAPWNVQQYTFNRRGNSIELTDRKSKEKLPVIFFHFHGLRFYTDNTAHFTRALYHIDHSVKSLFYIPYVNKLNEIKSGMTPAASVDPNGARNVSPARPLRVVEYFKEFAFLIMKHPEYIVKRKNFDLKNHLHYYQF
jgi:hypothetical protein